MFFAIGLLLVDEQSFSKVAQVIVKSDKRNSLQNYYVYTIIDSSLQNTGRTSICSFLVYVSFINLFETVGSRTSHSAVLACALMIQECCVSLGSTMLTRSKMDESITRRKKSMN